MRYLAERGARERAWQSVKRAVRAYARNPSDGNAEVVDFACRRVRHLATPVSRRRRPGGKDVARALPDLRVD